MKLSFAKRNIPTEQNEDEEVEISDSRRMRIFILFLLANAFLNYDTGVIPASLLEIMKEINLDYKEQALIGSLVYLGLSFASLFVTLFFNKWGPAKVCGSVLLLNTLCCFVFSYSKVKFILFGTRFLMGVSEAFIVIYGPVWVNCYSPEEHSAKWMGILHSCAALGVILGYIVASVTINFFSHILTWRFAIQVQGVLQIPIAIYFFSEREEFINVDMSKKNEQPPLSDNSRFSAPTINSNLTPRDKATQNNNSNNKNNKQQRPSVSGNKTITRDNSSFMKKARTNAMVRNSRKESRIDTVETGNLRLYCRQAYLVITNGLYISTCFGLCAMYFIVTGVQFWMTSYLIDILENDPIKVFIIFSSVSVTAPLAGVLMGGSFADQYGGYRGKNTLKALKLCFAFGVVAFVFAFPIGFLYEIIYITVLLWTFLFFGAAIIPVGTGIMVSSVRR